MQKTTKTNILDDCREEIKEAASVITYIGIGADDEELGNALWLVVRSLNATAEKLGEILAEVQKNG